MKSRAFCLGALIAGTCVTVLVQGQETKGGPPALKPATETVAPAIPGVVAGGTKVVVIKNGFDNTEGPVALPDGSVIFTESRASRITRIDKDNNISTFVENANHSDGLGFDSKGRLISTTNNTVEIVYPKGSEAVLAGPYETRPNDLVISKKDHIYFTLPSNRPPAVFHIAPGGKAEFAAEAGSPHGVQLSPDEKTLYVADSHSDALVVFDVKPDGTLTNHRSIGKYVGVTKGANGFFNSNADGIAIDSEGRIYVGTLQGVQVLTPQGENLGLIPVSQRPQNLAFAGPDKRTLYIAGQGAMYSVKMLSQGYMGRPK